MSSKSDKALRWRLVLGKHSAKSLEKYLPKDLNSTTLKEIEEEKNNSIADSSPPQVQESRESEEIISKNISEINMGKQPSQEGASKAEMIKLKASKYDQTLEFVFNEQNDNEILDTDLIRFDKSVVREIQKIKDKQGMGGSGHLFAIPEWIQNVNTLFPKNSAERLTKDAIERYNMTEILTEPEVLEKIEPSLDLAKTLLSFKGFLNDKTLSIARQIIRMAVQEIEEQLRSEIDSAFVGKRNRFQQSNLKVAKNFDFKKTVQKNLKNWDIRQNSIIINKPLFNSRIKHTQPWQLILTIDQSGSMLDSIIHCAVMAGIFASLKTLKTSIVLFDTEVVDLSDIIDDPVEILLSCTLGGGTDIGRAVQYSSSLITDHQKTILVLLTDFYEGGPPNRLYSQLKLLKEGGVTMIGLVALSPDANPEYSHEIAQKCMELGMDILSVTPVHLAQEIAKIINV